MSTLKVNSVQDLGGNQSIVNNNGTLELYGTTGISISSNGNVALTVDSFGNVLNPNNPVFSAYSVHSDLTGPSVIPYSVATVNVGNHYNTSTYRFTAPVAGFYLFSVYDIGLASNSITDRIQLRKNGVSTMGSLSHQLRMPNGGDYASGLSFWIMQAEVNDYFDVEVYSGSSYGTAEYAWFQGFRIG